jgi:hypothetical protein
MATSSLFKKELWFEEGIMYYVPTDLYVTGVLIALFQ